MKVYCKAETMQGESRVSIMPSNTRALTDGGHEPGVEKFAGVKSGFTDADYQRNDARILTREEVWGEADFLLSVKGPTVEEIRRCRGDFLFGGFCHLAFNTPLLYAFLDMGITVIDYGTIEREDTGTHILGEMSHIAGDIAFCEGRKLVKKHKGIELGPGAEALVLGIGRVGTAAALPTLETGTKLYVLDQYPEPIERFLERIAGTVPSSQIESHVYDPDSPRDQQLLAKILSHVDLAYGATHDHGKVQKRLAPRWMIQGMEPGSALLDVAMDQGGCFETSRATSIENPTFIECDVVHYCVQNMPGTRPLESTPALCNAAFPYIQRIADMGFEEAVRGNSAIAKALRKGVVTHKGKITHQGVAESINEQHTPLGELVRGT